MLSETDEDARSGKKERWREYGRLGQRGQESHQLRRAASSGRRAGPSPWRDACAFGARPHAAGMPSHSLKFTLFEAPAT